MPYHCLSTGEEEGLLEVVSPALTLLEIMRRGSGTSKSGFLTSKGYLTKVCRATYVLLED